MVTCPPPVDFGLLGKSLMASGGDLSTTRDFPVLSLALARKFLFSTVLEVVVIVIAIELKDNIVEGGKVEGADVVVVLIVSAAGA